MQVWFNHHGRFIEQDGRIIARGRKEERMFILDTNNVGASMYAKGQKVESYIDLCHKWFSHINFFKLQDM